MSVEGLALRALSFVSTNADVSVATNLNQTVPAPWPEPPKRQLNSGSPGTVVASVLSVVADPPQEMSTAPAQSSFDGGTATALRRPGALRSLLRRTIFLIGSALDITSLSSPVTVSMQTWRYTVSFEPSKENSIGSNFEPLRLKRSVNLLPTSTNSIVPFINGTDSRIVPSGRLIVTYSVGMVWRSPSTTWTRTSLTYALFCGTACATVVKEKSASAMDS